MMKKVLGIVALCAAMFIPQNVMGEEMKVMTRQQEGAIISASDSHIQYVGRISFKNPASPLFTFPGVQIRAAFTGTSLKMMAKPMSGYFMVEIDGSKAFKVGFNAERDSVVTLAAALPFRR